MLKARVFGGWVDPPGGLKLVNLPQPLNPGVIDQVFRLGKWVKAGRYFFLEGTQKLHQVRLFCSRQIGIDHEIEWLRAGLPYRLSSSA